MRRSFWLLAVSSALAEDFRRLSAAGRGQMRATCRIRGRGSGWRWLEMAANSRLSDPEIRGIVLNLRDVSEQMRLQLKLYHQARHDPLTGVAKGAFLEERYAEARARARRRLRSVVRDGETVGRIGGEEFVVVLEGADEDAAARVGGRVRGVLSKPFDLEGRRVPVVASAGIAASIEDVDLAELLRRADTALYGAKAAGQAGICSFAPPKTSPPSRDRDFVSGRPPAGPHVAAPARRRPVRKVQSSFV